MNILFIYPRMFHPYRGGIERVSDLLCRELIKRKHKVLFLHNICDESLEDYPYPAPIYFFPFSVQEVEKNAPFYRNFLIEHHVDIVINQDIMAYHALCRFSKDISGVKAISVLHLSPLNMYDHLFGLTMRLRNKSWIEKVKRIARVIKIPKIKSDYWQNLKVCYDDCFLYTDLFCLLSSKFIPELKRIHPGDMERVVAIGNPNTYTTQTFIETKKKQLLYVGRIEWYQKRVDRLIDIWRYLYQDFPDWELVIVGDGPTRKELEQKSSKMERVVFAGYQNPDSFYRDASILCMTSDFEGWGMVLTEAMTFGTIPVAFNSFAAITDIIEDGQTGVLVPPFSCKQFARKLGVLMKDEELRREMSKHCMEHVKRFDIQNVVDEWEKVFDRLKNNQ